MLNDLAKNLKPITSAGLRDQIEDQVTSAILNGVLKPGEHLVESTIAERLQVSRAPVREALSALEREGIIVNVPRRGYFVMEFTPKDIEEIYSLRLLLEIGALRRAIDRFTDADIGKMQEIVDSLGTAVEEEWEQASISSLDLSFHELICQTADHLRLFSVWNRMRMQTWMLIGMTSRTHQDHPHKPKQFHQEILDAILEKDLKRAEALLSDHLIDAQQRALRVLETPPTESKT
jgi:DNA-binding GntR family transcriptional regulator